jgi:YegS/Rv2252/BmrU family lipid kinase
LNRSARGGRCDPAAALDRLRSAGFDLIEPPVDRPTELAPAIRDFRNRVDCVIVGGGDGTLTMAVDGLVDAGLPLGILPLGTANDLARTLGLPTEPVAAAEVIIQGRRKAIDLGWVNGTHFFNVASLGLGTGITRRLSGPRKGRWGVFAYLFAAAQAIWQARPFSADIRTTTETIRVRTIQVTVGNGRHYGGGMTVDESARIDDGLLHLFSLEVDRWWQILPLLPALRRGTFKDARRVRTLRGQEFEVTPVKKRRMKVLADGELSGRAPARFRLIPRALTIFVPPDDPPPEDTPMDVPAEREDVYDPTTDPRHRPATDPPAADPIAPRPRDPSGDEPPPGTETPGGPPAPANPPDRS